MIFRITKKEYLLEVEKRKRSSLYKSALTFFHHQGKYYKSNAPKGVQALREIHEFRITNKTVANASIFDDNQETDGAS